MIPSGAPGGALSVKIDLTCGGTRQVRSLRRALILRTGSAAFAILCRTVTRVASTYGMFDPVKNASQSTCGREGSHAGATLTVQVPLTAAQSVETSWRSRRRRSDAGGVGGVGGGA